MPDNSLYHAAVKQSLSDLLDQAEALINARLSAITIKDKRTKDEQKLQGEIEAIFEDYADMIAGYVKRGKPIPQSVYDDMGVELQAAIAENLKDVYIAGALVARSDLDKALNIGINWNAPNTDAMKWVKQYSFDLVRGLQDTTQLQVQANIAALQNDVSKFFNEPTSLGELRGNIEKYIPDWRDRLGHVWSSEARAEMIAITETTRASVQGQVDSVQYLEDEYGLKMAAIFQTSNDEKVCDECGPLDGKAVEEPDYPPLHPNCRCNISFEMQT